MSETHKKTTAQPTKNKTSKTRYSISAIVVLSLVAILFPMIIIFISFQAEYINDKAQLNNFDFGASIAYISPTIFDHHPNALYTPEDFANGSTTPPSYLNNTAQNFATYRLVLDLDEGTVYGLSGYSATFAMALWVDGVALATAGVPGNSLENMTPSANYFTVYFTAGAAATEIIIQRSGFVHVSGGRLNHLHLGEQHLITAMNNQNHIRVSMMIGVTLLAALLFLSMYLFFRNQLQFLWFSAVCITIAIRAIAMDYEIIMTLLPDFNWELKTRLVHLSTSGYVALVLLYANAMFQNKFNRFVVRGTLIYFVIDICITMFSPIYFFTGLSDFYNVMLMLIAFAFFFNMIWLMVKNPALKHIEYVLVWITGTANILLGFAEITLRLANPLFASINFMLAGAIIFVFINTIALALNFHRAEDTLHKERLKNIEADETNKMLAKLSTLKTNFLADISHEMKSPLYTMSGYAQLTERQITAGTVTEDTKKNLRVITEEAGRLSELVERLLEVSTAKAEASSPIRVSVGDIISRAVALCSPMLSTHANTLEVHIQESCPPVAANPDMILQVLYNLLGNASRHADNSVIYLHAENTIPEMVTFVVADKGTGIHPEIFGKIFERGVTGDGSSGLGLPICKEAVEIYGGTIEIDSKLGEGTVVRFTLPVYLEEKSHKHSN